MPAAPGVHVPPPPASFDLASGSYLACGGGGASPSRRGMHSSASGSGGTPTSAAAPSKRDKHSSYSGPSSKTRVCRYFLSRNNNHFGRTCAFLHPCRALMVDGMCPHGKRCTDDHVCPAQIFGHGLNGSCTALPGACMYYHVTNEDDRQSLAAMFADWRAVRQQELYGSVVSGMGAPRLPPPPPPLQPAHPAYGHAAADVGSMLSTHPAIGMQGSTGMCALSPLPASVMAPCDTERGLCPFWYVETQSGCKAGPECIYTHRGQFQLPSRPMPAPGQRAFAERAWAKRIATDAEKERQQHQFMMPPSHAHVYAAAHGYAMPPPPLPPAQSQLMTAYGSMPTAQGMGVCYDPLCDCGAGPAWGSSSSSAYAPMPLPPSMSSGMYRRSPTELPIHPSSSAMYSGVSGTMLQDNSLAHTSYMSRSNCSLISSAGTMSRPTPRLRGQSSSSQLAQSIESDAMSHIASSISMLSLDASARLDAANGRSGSVGGMPPVLEAAYPMHSWQTLVVADGMSGSSNSSSSSEHSSLTSMSSFAPSASVLRNNSSLALSINPWEEGGNASLPTLDDSTRARLPHAAHVSPDPVSVGLELTDDGVDDLFSRLKFSFDTLSSLSPATARPSTPSLPRAALFPLTRTVSNCSANSVIVPAQALA